MNSDEITVRRWQELYRAGAFESDSQEALDWASCAAHGLSTDTVCNRVQQGCSLFAALNIPDGLEIKVKTIRPGKLRYKVDKTFLAESCVFEGTEQDLRDFVEESKGNT